MANPVPGQLPRDFYNIPRFPYSAPNPLPPSAVIAPTPPATFYAPGGVLPAPGFNVVPQVGPDAAAHRVAGPSEGVVENPVLQGEHS